MNQWNELSKKRIKLIYEIKESEEEKKKYF